MLNFWSVSISVSPEGAEIHRINSAKKTWQSPRSLLFLVAGNLQARIACFLMQPGAAKRFEELSLVGPSWWFQHVWTTFLSCN